VSKNPTNSVKALKEEGSYRLGFNAIRSTPECYNNKTRIQYDKKHKHKGIYAQ